MKAKKILAIVVALALCIGCVSMVASADTTATTTTAPENFAAMIEDWNDVAIENLDAAPGDCVNTATEDGLLDLSCSSGTRISVKGDLVTYNDDTGVVTGDKVAGVNLSLATDSVKGVAYDSADSGVALYVEISGNFKNFGTADFDFYLGTMDKDNDGSGKREFIMASATPDPAALTADGFKGWIYLPMNTFADNIWSLGADSNGYFDLSKIVYFYLDVAGYSTDSEALTFKVGQIGFYGDEFATPDPHLVGETAPAKSVTLVDTSAIDFTDSGFIFEDSTATGSIEDGMIKVVATGGKWYQPANMSFFAVDDETGAFGDLLPGFKSTTAQYDLTSTTAGLAFYVDASDLVKTDDPFWVDIYLGEFSYNDDGTVVKKAGKEVNTWYNVRAVLPAGYKGWVQVPFSEINADPEAWDSSEVNGKFDGKCVNSFTYVSSIYPSDGADGVSMTLKMGDIVVWGDPIPGTEPGTSTGGTSTGGTSTGGTSTGNVDTGATAATGIASGLAIASLAVVAAVCFRKKND